MALNLGALPTAVSHASTLDFSKAVAVTSGQRIDFTKDNPNVTKVRVELYWKGDVDGDASVVILDDNDVALPGVTAAERAHPTGANGTINTSKTRGMVWYKNSSVPGITHSGDVTGADEDDTAPEETIIMELAKLEAEAKKALIVASTYPHKDDSAQKAVPFGMMRNCKVLVIDDSTSQVLYMYELSEDYDQFTSVELCQFYLRNNEWRMVNMGTGVGKSAQALTDIATKYKL